MIEIQHYLLISALVFILGLYTVVTRRNALGILLGTELVLNAAALNMVIFGFNNNRVAEASIFSIFIIVLAAAEAVVALVVGLLIYRNFETIDTMEVNELKG